MITSTRKVIQIKFLFVLFFQGEGEWVGAGGAKICPQKLWFSDTVL